MSFIYKARLRFILIPLILLLNFSCSILDQQRNIASIETELPKEAILKIFEFKASEIIDPKKDYIKRISNISQKRFFNPDIKLEFFEDESLAKDVAYFPEFYANNNNYKIIVHYSKGAKNDIVASNELFYFLEKFNNKEYFMESFAAYEMYYNAINADPIALVNWIKIRSDTKPQPNSDFQLANIKHDEMLKELEIRNRDWLNTKEDFTHFVKEKSKNQKSQDQVRRTVIEVLDKAGDDKQFKNLIAKNDRAGATDLIKKYLPWEQMAPFEKRYWETYLDVLEHPLPLEKRVLIYRGLDGDFIYSAYKDGAEISKELAQKNGDVFVMSTLISKNQGTWNRRLRSLTAMNEKFIATNVNLESEYTKSARIVTMFYNHSLNPQGSPFLSFTPDFEVARKFGENKMSAYLLDPRLLSYNFASEYGGESEFLVPLMTFPEDVVAYFDKTIHSDLKNSEKLLKTLFKQRLLKSYDTYKADEILLKVQENSKRYFDSAIKRSDGQVVNSVKSGPNIFSQFFNKLKGTSVSSPGAKIPDSGNACIDLLSSFWK